MSEAQISQRQKRRPAELTIVVPVFNEGDVLEQFWSRTRTTLASAGLDYSILFVNDGSMDDSTDILASLAARSARVAVLTLSRNFGKELALTAGLDHADGDAVVVMDADLQDPPELIPEMVQAWRSGFDVVAMRRRRRDGESPFKKLSAWLYYRLMRWTADIAVPEDTGDFRLLSRRAVESLRQMPERQRYMKGLFAWIGFPQTTLYFDRSSRAAGSTKMAFRDLLRLATDGITSFSTAPLRLATFVGAIVSLVAFGDASWIISKTLLFGEPVAGFPTLMVAILFLGGVQLLAIGILGTYVGRLFIESKQRPRYIIENYRQESTPRSDALQSRRSA